MPEPQVQNPIEQLEGRIKSNDTTITKDDIEKAFKDEEAIVTALYDKLADKGGFARRDHLERLASYKLQVLAEATDLKSAYEAGRLKILDESRKLRERIDVHVMDTQARGKAFDRAHELGVDLTDPSYANAQIPDYEGYSVSPLKKGLEDENINNPTRRTLIGLAEGMEVCELGGSTKIMADAKAIYENSSHFDKALALKDLLKGANVEKHVSDLSKYNFSDEANGFFAAYLKMAEQYGGTNNEYRAYLFGELDKMAIDGKFEYKATKQDTSDLIYDFNKGAAEVNIARQLKTPKEWLEENRSLNMAAASVGVDAKFLSDNLKFTYADQKVKDFLAKDPSKMSKADESDIAYAKTMAGREGYAAMLNALGVFNNDKAAVKAKLDTLGGKNPQAIQQYADIETIMKDVNLLPVTTLDGVALQCGLYLKAKAILDNLKASLGVKGGVPIAPAIAGAGVAGAETGSSGDGKKSSEGGAKTDTPGSGEGAKAKEGGEKKDDTPSGPDIYKDNWSRGEYVEPKFKRNNELKVADWVNKGAVVRDDNGSIVGKLDAGKDCKIKDLTDKAKKVEGLTFIKVEYDGKSGWIDESQLKYADAKFEGKPEDILNEDQKRFVEDKALYFRSYDRATFGTDVAYEIGLDANQFRVRGDGTLDFRNVEANANLGEKFNKILKEIPGFRLDKNLNKTLENIGSDSALNSYEKAEKSIQAIKNSLMANVPDQHKSRAQVLCDGLDVAFLESRGFIHGEKEINQLEGKYGTDVRSGFDKAAAKLGGIVDGCGINGPKAGPGIEFLGNVNDFYLTALNAVDRYRANPESFPQGATFNLKLNNQDLACRFKKEADGCNLYYEGGSMKFASAEDFMTKLNNGEVYKSLMLGGLIDKNWYKAYESMVGEVDDLDQIPNTSKAKLELDWDNPDPQISLEVLPHGRIQFTIERENIGIRGENKRTGTAENFVDLMTQFEHLKKWAEAPEHKAEETGKQKVESTMEQINDVNVYKKAEARIGKLIGTTRENNGVTHVYLNWGGGDNYLDSRNAALNVWTGVNGEVIFNIAGHGVGPDGRGYGPEQTSDMESMIARVEAVKNEALAEKTS